MRQSSVEIALCFFALCRLMLVSQHHRRRRQISRHPRQVCRLLDLASLRVHLAFLRVHLASLQEHHSSTGTSSMELSPSVFP